MKLMSLILQSGIFFITTFDLGTSFSQIVCILHVNC